MEKGNIGYIDSVKKRNLKYGISGIAAMFAIYIMGLMITGTNASYGTLIAVLLALPAAQMLSRYFSMYSYRSTDRALAEAVEAIGAKALYELVVVYGKKSCFIESVSVSRSGVEILTTDTVLTGKDFESMLRAKGIRKPVRIHRERQLFLKHLDTTTDQEKTLMRFKENAL